MMKAMGIFWDCLIKMNPINILDVISLVHIILDVQLCNEYDLYNDIYNKCIEYCRFR